MVEEKGRKRSQDTGLCWASRRSNHNRKAESASQQSFFPTCQSSHGPGQSPEPLAEWVFRAGTGPGIGGSHPDSTALNLNKCNEQMHSVLAEGWLRLVGLFVFC